MSLLEQRREFLRRIGIAVGSLSVAGCGGGGGGSAAAAAGSGSAADASVAASPAPMPSAGAGVAAAPAPAPAPTGRAAFTLQSGVAGSAPFCIGHAFRKGDVPAGQAVVADLATLQVTPKNRWPDGSLKFAIVAGRATLQAGGALTVTLSSSASAPAAGPALTLADLKATGVAATIDGGAFGSASWSGADWDAPAQAWVSGEQMSSWVYRKPVGADAHLMGWLEVRLYAGGAVEVLPWIENGYLRLAGAGNRAATYRFVLGGSERFNQAIDLPAHARTPLVSGAALSHWLGSDPQVTPKHDTAYLQASGLVPSYRATVAPGASAVTALPASFVPLQQGSFPPGMGAGGYHPSIGLLPEWDVLYLTTTSARAYAGVVFNGYSAGRYGIHFRDEATQRPLRFSSHPTLVLGDGRGVPSSGASSTNDETPNFTGTVPPAWATSHHPSIGFMAYLVTGRWYFMEQVQFAATLSYLKNGNLPRNGKDGLLHSAAGANTTRGAAWSIRTLAQAACATPDDDSALRAEFVASLQANVDWNHARYVAQPSNPLGWVQPYSDYSGTGDNKYVEAAWMQDFYTAAYGYALSLELPLAAASGTRLAEFFAWKARSIVGRLGGTASTDYLFSDAAVYTVAIAPTDTPDYTGGTGPWFAHWGEAYAATLGAPNPGTAAPLRGAYFPDASSYWGNLQPAIAYAVQHRVPGAVDAYRRMTGAANWPQIVAAFDGSPVWGVRPSVEP